MDIITNQPTTARQGIRRDSYSLSLLDSTKIHDANISQHVDAFLFHASRKYAHFFKRQLCIELHLPKIDKSLQSSDDTTDTSKLWNMSQVCVNDRCWEPGVVHGRNSQQRLIPEVNSGASSSNNQMSPFFFLP